MVVQERMCWVAESAITVMGVDPKASLGGKVIFLAVEWEGFWIDSL